MSGISNSLSNLADNLIKLQQNNNDILLKLSEIVNSDAETVTFTLQDNDNQNIKTVTIPSLGNIKKDIERLENNIEQLTTLNDANADVRLKDGTFRTIIKSTLSKPADSIKTTAVPTSFNSKNNWFFEDFLNPFLYIGLDYTGQMNPSTKKIKAYRFILNLDNNEKLNIYNERIKNNPDLSYSDFLDIITENGITYALDEDVVDLPPVEPRFYGNFSVLRVFEDVETVTSGTTTFNKKSLKFQLDKLFYSDKTSVTLETQQLKVGDSLLVNKGERNTRYRITSIDFEKNIISVVLVEGFDSVGIGSDILSFYSTQNLTPEVRIGIGFNEYLAVFLKPIDPISNIPADKFSPCIGFYTNDLTINDGGVVKNLSTYYQESVVDFGAYLFSMAKENIPPVSKGIKPDAPAITTDNFKVVQVNKHATDTSSKEELKKLNAEKNELKGKVKELDKAIRLKRLEISTKQYTSNIERNTDNNILTDLISDRDRNQTLYNSVVSDILSKKEDTNTVVAKAKFRVRGFWDLPEPKLGADGRKQDIIQFKIEYRYITKEGSANNLDEFEFDSENGTKKGVFSNWLKYNGPLRERVLNPVTGNYEWVEQNLESGEQININQLDLSIGPNEGIEIRIKSVSEAGFPTNPIESSWSNVVAVNFPDDLDISKEVADIFKETQNESVKVDLVNELIEKGVYDHIDDQFTQNNTLWKHQSLNIASGFLSEEQNVISLFDYLKKLENKVLLLEEELRKSKGELIVLIEDTDGNQREVKNNQDVQIFAGNYKDIVSNLGDQNGVIVVKSYFLRLQNKNATPIELLATFDGLDFSGSKQENVSDNNYINVPIGLLNPSGNNQNSNPLPFMSRQVKGSYIYLRSKDLEGNDLYDNSLLDGEFPQNINAINRQRNFGEVIRISFKDEDKELEGTSACGAFLFMAPISYEDIRVDGNSLRDKKELTNESDITIQIQYQFRMTDINGNIGGDPNNTNTLEYSKKLGFDIYWNKNKFTFDLTVFSRYQSRTLSEGDIPTLSVNNTRNLV